MDDSYLLELHLNIGYLTTESKIIELLNNPSPNNIMIFMDEASDIDRYLDRINRDIAKMVAIPRKYLT